MSDRPRLLLDPANPHDFDPGELEQIAAGLEAEVPDVEAVAVRRPEDGYGGPFMEVLHVWEEGAVAVDAVTTTAAGAKWLIGALQARWRKDRDEHPSPEKPRPRVFNLYNENEELIRSVLIDLPDGEPAESEVVSSEHAPHPRPKVDRAAGTSVADELSKLADLRESGALSPEEFAAAKARVLGAAGG